MIKFLSRAFFLTFLRFRAIGLLPEDTAFLALAPDLTCLNERNAEDLDRVGEADVFEDAAAFLRRGDGFTTPGAAFARDDLVAASVAGALADGTWNFPFMTIFGRC